MKNQILKTPLKKRSKSVAYYWANHAKVLAYKKKYYWENHTPERIKKQKERLKQFHIENPDYEKVRYRRRKSYLWAEFYTHYGEICICCGESQKLFLSIDHINNDGKQHRKSLGGGTLPMLYSIRRQGFPKDRYRLLCMNCNWGRQRNKGICPHELSKKAEFVFQEETQA